MRFQYEMVKGGTVLLSTLWVSSFLFRKERFYVRKKI